MKEGWEVKKLSSTFNIKSSRRVHQSDWQQQGIPFYRAREVVLLSKFGFVNNELFISEELYGEFTKIGGAPKYGDLIVSAVGTLGCCYQVKVDDKFYFKDASVLWFEKKTDVNSRFIEYAFKSDSIISQISAGSVGATVGTLTINRAKELKIPIPPLPEQQRIVSIIDQAFEAIDKAIENTQKNLQNANELFESYLNNVFEKVGEGWEHKTIKELTSVLGDGLHGTPQYTHDGEYYFINGNNLTDGTIELKENTKRVSVEEYNKYKKNLTDRTVFVSINGTLGNVAFYNGEKIILGKSACYFNLKENVYKDFIKYVLSSPYFLQYAHKEATGATIKNVSLKTMREFVVPLPDLKTQQTIVQKLNALNSETKNLESKYQQKHRDLEELKKSILNKAFAGEL